eukprot:gnl/TRDRNA2_/TRDRNA2_139789_c1_seq1.p1 gnl/TRDRNA2_/TRDRNA2_139789_c1~~gnl/TRDRNA2_/TRDRNA2_139789_c1_seq1.p1  ORF type:complete len:612 (+),score=106.10 gnl/TRDRNA2_/TRDRNA2_139789_c1_seq1:254-1837(+)
MGGHHQPPPRRACPMCGHVTFMSHCMLCGGSLFSTHGIEYKCESCPWQLDAVNFCMSCGQPLRSLVCSASTTMKRQLTTGGSSSSVSETSTPGPSRASPTPSPVPSPNSRSSLERGFPAFNGAEKTQQSMSFTPTDRVKKVKAGTLWKVGRNVKMLTSRYFVLDDRFLYYYKSQADRWPKGVIFLEGSTVRAEQDEVPKGKFGIAIYQGSTQRRRILLASSEQDRLEWVTVLSAATRKNSILDFYKVGDQELGRGKFATVKEATTVHPPETKLAVKIISKTGISSEDREYIRTEIAILKLVDHPNVVKLIGLFDEPENLFLVMERVIGGDLLRRLLQLPDHRVYEPTSQTILRCLLSGVQYLHEHGITHRDLKPENVLVEDPWPADDTDDITGTKHAEVMGRISSVKITDFGLSAITGQAMQEPLGTVAYAAPEILTNKAYDRAVDVWSLGVLAYVTLCGQLPFSGQTDNATARCVAKGKFEFSHPHWANISDVAKHFIKCLLSKQPTERPSAAAALEHQWLAVSSV